MIQTALYGDWGFLSASPITEWLVAYEQSDYDHILQEQR